MECKMEWMREDRSPELEQMCKQALRAELRIVEDAGAGDNFAMNTPTRNLPNRSKSDNFQKHGAAVDAMRTDNNLRFVNHSEKPNCDGRNMIVNGKVLMGYEGSRDHHKVYPVQLSSTNHWYSRFRTPSLSPKFEKMSYPNRRPTQEDEEGVAHRQHMSFRNGQSGIVIENWKICAIATKFTYPTQSLLKTMSLCIGLALTVERWVAVCKPLEALARCTQKISIRMLKVIACGDCSAPLSINSGVEKIPATCGTTYNFESNKYGEAVDAMRTGNNLRFVNHSEEPNCEVRNRIANGKVVMGFEGFGRRHRAVI
ncbi:unnamed protein product [Caenorhabditis nigoni]